MNMKTQTLTWTQYGTSGTRVLLLNNSIDLQVLPAPATGDHANNPGYYASVCNSQGLPIKHLSKTNGYRIRYTTLKRAQLALVDELAVMGAQLTELARNSRAVICGGWE